MRQIKEITLNALGIYEVFSQSGKIAEIRYDADAYLTRPYLVEVNGEEVHCANTIAKAERYVFWHYQQGTLPIWVEDEPDAVEPTGLLVEDTEQFEYTLDKKVIGYLYLKQGWWSYDRKTWVTGWREAGTALVYKQIKNDSVRSHSRLMKFAAGLLLSVSIFTSIIPSAIATETCIPGVPCIPWCKKGQNPKRDKCRNGSDVGAMRRKRDRHRGEGREEGRGERRNDK